MTTVEPTRSGFRHLLVNQTGLGRAEPWVTDLTACCRSWPIRLRQARTGPEVIAAVERGLVDAAVLTVDPVDGFGLSVVQIVRSIDARLPLVVLTGDRSRTMLERALDLGAYSVVTRPVDHGSLRRVVAGMFRRCFQLNLE